MMPYEPVLDIMRRTMANLEFVEQRASKDGPFEVTQLINSFLGAWAHPWEALRDDLNSLSIADVREQGWPIPSEERKSDQSPSNFGELIKLIRHSIAHGNISFLPGTQGQIAALRIENWRSRRRTWGIIINVPDMRAFLVKFVILVEDMAKSTACRPRSIA